MSCRGYWGFGVYHPKTEVNIGTLWRSAHAFGASFLFTVGRRYKQQSSDVTVAWKHLPLWHFETMEDLKQHLPHSCPLIGVELDERARSLANFCHPERCCYLLGAEDHGLPLVVMDQCHQLIQIPSLEYCLNVASAGTVVMYDRMAKAS